MVEELGDREAGKREDKKINTRPTLQPVQADARRANHVTRLLALNETNPLLPYLFLLPQAVAFLIFTAYPLGYGLWISTHRWDPLAVTQPYVGLEFYRHLIDPSSTQFVWFWRSLLNTLFFVGVSVPLLIGISVSLALQLHRPIFGRSFFRTVFFMPGILSVTVMGILWRWMFDNNNGLVNSALSGLFGLHVIPFLNTDWLAWLPIIIGTVWWTVGFNMTLYLAALAGISQSYYEAADLDGAGSWAKFRFITWPLLSTTTLFVGVTTVLASFQLFGQSIIITGGGPSRSTLSIIQYITEEGFTNSQFSSATAMSFAFGLVLLVFTVIQFRFTVRGLTSRSRS